MVLTVLVLAILLAGSALLAAGIVVLLKSKNKLAGLVVLAVGVAFILVPVLFILSQMVTIRVTG